MAEFALTLSCPDRAGIVHAVAAYLHEAGCNVLDSQQFADRTAGRFFMRVHVETLPPALVSYHGLHSGFARWRPRSTWTGSCTTPRSGRGC
jgi:formyltetrahydrofolate deformylase